MTRIRKEAVIALLLLDDEEVVLFCPYFYGMDSRNPTTKDYFYKTQRVLFFLHLIISSYQPPPFYIAFSSTSFSQVMKWIFLPRASSDFCCIICSIAWGTNELFVATRILSRGHVAESGARCNIDIFCNGAKISLIFVPGAMEQNRFRSILLHCSGDKILLHATKILLHSMRMKPWVTNDFCHARAMEQCCIACAWKKYSVPP